MPTLLVGLAFMISCSEDDSPIITTPLEVITVENIHAPNDVIDRTSGEVVQQNPFRYFSFEKNALAESVDGNWDIGFKGTTIIVNSGSSGPGNASGMVMEGLFSELAEVPESATLRQDTEDELAIPSGSGNGWYNYNNSTHLVSPRPGRFLVFQTNAGNYVKMEILSYYRDNPPMDEVDFNTGGYYTFDYVLQPNGRRAFDN
ncbi:HmuY family protein [Pleomorphovibrio marinus]|uniref:HmuY family protein n=1 Tax=Pleomorphovibrio marinus TaxID=2164132 RepID=UPI000E0B5E7E|nr:HmuY family protein [Pleomorphovibrio marinus]